MPSVHALVLTCATALVALTATAAPRREPTKPVTARFEPGRSTIRSDASSRPKHAARRQFIVENRGGAAASAASWWLKDGLR
jgi:hypothetical protein